MACVLSSARRPRPPEEGKSDVYRARDHRDRSDHRAPGPADGGPHRPGVPAARRVRPRPVPEDGRPGARAPPPTAGPKLRDRRPPRIQRRDPAADLHHQGQRDDLDRLPDLPAGRRGLRLGDQGPELPTAGPADRLNDPSRRHRRPRPGRRVRQARADERGPPDQARRRDPSLGGQGQPGRDPRDRATAGDPGGHDPSDDGRTDPPRVGHRGRGQAGVRDPRGRG